MAGNPELQYALTADTTLTLFQRESAFEDATSAKLPAQYSQVAEHLNTLRLASPPSPLRAAEISLARRLPRFLPQQRGDAAGQSSASTQRFKSMAISAMLVILSGIGVVLVQYAFQPSLMLSGENNGEF
ncbi:hypothetical protein V502_06743 [Pseudogymnoascus sp. VKM F-4520 (FW-2644)]|nr:hypothetical protein V502_06743 [Pseudogymnoascus sp. VKM F-4520 (FW-2644)]